MSPGSEDGRHGKGMLLSPLRKERKAGEAMCLRRNGIKNIGGMARRRRGLKIIEERVGLADAGRGSALGVVRIFSEWNRCVNSEGIPLRFSRDEASGIKFGPGGIQNCELGGETASGGGL